MIRVGFVLAALGDDWIGGRNYVSNLLRIVAGLDDRRIETVLFALPDADSELLKRFPADRVVRTCLFKPRTVWRIAARIARKLAGRSVLDEGLFRHHGVAAGALMAPLGARSRVPTASWIPDFQHVHLPGLFQREELAQRDRIYREYVRNAALVILSSESALADFERFAPEARHKGRVLRFVAEPPQGPVPDLAELRATYGIEEPFLYLPNQFWAHKNHRVVIDALAILQARDEAPLVVCTGGTTDYRQPNYYSSLMRHAEEAGVSERFRVLGVVPYPHVMALFDQCMAVINPSLFEGWSTSLEEAKSRGKRVLYSAIPTHVEQDPVRGLPFPPENAAALADRTVEVIRAFDPTVEAAAQAVAKAALPSRVRAFGLTFQSIMLEAAAMRPTVSAVPTRTSDRS